MLKSPGPKLDPNKANTHILPEFEYLAPRTVEEAIELLSKYGEEAKVLAGSTDLLVRMKQGVLRPKYVISINRIKELNFIEDRGDHVAIGAATKLRALEKSSIIKELFPALHEAIKSMGAFR